MTIDEYMRYIERRSVLSRLIILVATIIGITPIAAVIAYMEEIR